MADESMAGTVELCRDQLKALQEDVAHLENLLEEETRPRKDAHTPSILSFSTKQRNAKAASSTEERDPPDINTLQKKLELNSSISGVELTGNTQRLLSVDGFAVKKERIVTGCCDDVSFYIVLLIDESQDATGRHDGHISGLEITLDGAVDKELDSAAKRIEEMCNIQLFFRVLSSYMKHCKQRKLALDEIAQQNPAIVSLKASGIVIKGLGFRCIISWDIRMNSGFAVEAVQTLEVKISSKVITGARQVLSQAPDMFQKMVKASGPKQAITRLIESISDQ